MQLRIPGPTPVPANILAAGARQMINHRGPEFVTLMRDVSAGLKRWFQTENDVFIMTASGTGGLETAIVNTFSPGDRVLAVSIGAFGDRFAEIARVFGADVTKLDFPAGSPADPDVIRQKLQSDGPFKAVLVTHNETSTGVTNDVASIGRAVRAAAPDALLLVDAISALSSIDMKADAWGCDVVISGSQKGWMIPPGLTFISYGPRAWAAHATAKMPRFYFDLTAAKKNLDQGQTPATPAVSLFFALDAALKMLDQEGMTNVFQRHARVAARAREGVKALDLELLVADERYASNTVTAVKKPGDLDLSKFLKILRDEHQVILSGGQASLSGKIFRIGHLGYVDVADMDEVLTAIKLTLPRAM
jgi:aspartate aminotransferase-like enzyme